jgi:TolB protein
MSSPTHRSTQPWLTLVGLALVLGIAATPFESRSQTAGEGSPLPESLVEIVVDSPESQMYRIGIPDVFGSSSDVADVLRNDFRLMPGYTVIDTRSIRHDLVAEGLDIRAGAWATLDANGVIKGELRQGAEGVELTLRFFRVSAPGTPAFEHTYRGPLTHTRRWAHEFANEVLRVLTGTPGVFGTEIAYARRAGPGAKDVFKSFMDGFGERRVSTGTGISLLPSFGHNRIWFTRMTERGMYITNGRARDARIVQGDGINMAPAVCDGRIYFTSSRDGNSEIYSTALDGSDVRRLTDHPAMDLSPACGPNNQLAFVSSRHRTPQIFTMNRDGSNVQRVTFRGTHNQTPTWCMDPARPWIAFTGRDGAYDIFMVNTRTQEYVRLTQGQGDNKDPAFSPDCRLVAFVSDRRDAAGVYVASPQGYNQTRVVTGNAETVRWSQWETYPATTPVPAEAPAPAAAVPAAAVPAR